MVKVNRCFQIKPAKPTPTTAISVSELDQGNPVNHTLVVYFFRTSFSFTLASQILRESLSQVLVHFYPLAGRLHFIPGGGGRVTIEGNPSTVIFNEAESAAKIEDLKDFLLPDELKALVPFVDFGVSELHEVPLLMVQLTRLGCGAISLGIGFSNIVGDGPSASHFLAEWARIARGEPLENQPFLDRSVLLAADPPILPRFKHTLFDPLPILIGRSDDQEERRKETMIIMLHLSKDQVEKLKETANQTCPADIPRPFSRFEAIAGHMWRCACKAWCHQPMQPTRVHIDVSIKGRMPLPKWYFGNAVLEQAACSQAGELVESPLSYACGKMREVVDMVTEEYVKSALDDIKRQPDLTPFRISPTLDSTTGYFDGNPNMEIVSWINVNLDGLDFGWGKSAYMCPATIDGGESYVFPGIAGGEGSVSVALRFQVAHVDDFKKYFYQLVTKSTL